MGYKQFIVLFSFLIPIIVSCQNYPRFELYQLKQGTDSGQFIVTGLDSNLAFNNVLRFRSADSTFLIGLDTVITDKTIIPILLRTIDAGLGIDVNQVDEQIFIESLSIEDSIYNGTASLISKGTPLYAVGVQGNYWSVAPADASNPNKMPVVVIAGEDIAAGATGVGLIKGHIKQVNTTGLADGAEVYVASGGGYTSTKPTAEGVIIQRLGTVIKGNSTSGSGIINLGDEAYWNDYVDRTELGDSLVLYPNRTELSDTALAIRTDIPSLDGVVLTTTNQTIDGVKTFNDTIVGIISNSAAVDVQYVSSGSYYPALISNGIGANNVRLNTNIKYDMTNNEFTMDNYVFDVDEVITGKQGEVLTLNSSGVIELDKITTLHTLTATIRDQASDSVVIMTIPTEYIGCKIIETTQSFYAENYYGSSPVIFGSISGSTFTNNGNLIAEYVTGTGYLSLIRNTTGGIYTYPETITSTARYIIMQRPVYSGSVRTITNAITIQCN